MCKEAVNESDHAINASVGASGEPKPGLVATKDAAKPVNGCPSN